MKENYLTYEDVSAKDLWGTPLHNYDENGDIVFAEKHRFYGFPDIFAERPILINGVHVNPAPTRQDAFDSWYYTFINHKLPQMGTHYMTLFTLLHFDPFVFFYTVKRIEHKGISIEEGVEKIKQHREKLEPTKDNKEQEGDE